MKKIDAAFKETKKAVCPFCSLGCDFGININDFGICGVEYLKEGSSNGRLCPRGSASAMYLNHPKRLSMPIKKDKTIKWPKLVKDLNKVFAGPDKLAVTFDRNITLEEYELIISCCQANGIENVASSYLEPESVLADFVGKPLGLASPGVVVVVGDPFNQSPMISKSLLDWKMSDRRNQLIVIDSLFTHTASFASNYLPVVVGAEPLILYALAQETGVKTDGLVSISTTKINELANTLKNVINGAIMVSIPFGHTYDPGLLADSLGVLSKATGKSVFPLVEYVAPVGKVSFPDFLKKNKKGGLNYLVNMGELFPYYYPQLIRELKFKEIFATSPLKQQGYTTIPCALNLEKNGTINTNNGKKKLNGNIKPASGSYTVTEIINMLDIKKNGPVKIEKPDYKIDRGARIDVLVEKVKARPKKKSLRLVGEKIAYNFLNIFDDEVLKINPVDARENGVLDNELINIESKKGKSELKTKITNAIPPGLISVATESAATRGLFDYDIVDEFIYFIPTEVQVWRKG